MAFVNNVTSVKPTTRTGPSAGNVQLIQNDLIVKKGKIQGGIFNAEEILVSHGYTGCCRIRH